MKKVFILVLVFACLIGLAGCDPAMHHLSKEELLENTVKIELVYYENEDPESVNIRRDRKPKYDFSKATLLATLDESRFEDILTDLSGSGYTYYARALNEPMGKTLVLHQSNGNMIVLFGCTYTNKKGSNKYYGNCYVFDKDGVFIDLIGDVGYLFSDRIESTYFKNDP